MVKIVIDTNVIVSALRSKKGASYALINLLPSDKFQITISVPLYTEYLDVLTRKENMTGASSKADIVAFCQYLASIACRKNIFYLWRPWLRDPKDDMVLELAVASNSQYIVTYNIKDFKHISSFGIQAIQPADFLNLINER